MAKVKSIIVEVSRSIQLIQYFPAAITLREELEIEKDDDVAEVRNKAYKKLSRLVTEYLDNEQSKFDKANKKKK